MPELMAEQWCAHHTLAGCACSNRVQATETLCSTCKEGKCALGAG